MLDFVKYFSEKNEKNLKKFNSCVRLADMNNIMEGFTVEEMANALGIKPTTVRQRLMVAGIKPKTKSPLYETSALEAIRTVAGKGRPPKQKAPKKADEPK